VNRSAPRGAEFFEALADDPRRPPAAGYETECVLLGAAAAVAAAVGKSHLICLCTNAAEPLFPGSALPARACHVMSAGSYTPGMREVDAVAMGRFDVVVADTHEAMSVGDLAQAPGWSADGGGGTKRVLELGEVLGEGWEGGGGGLTFFNSVGHAAQDSAAAGFAGAAHAEKAGRGRGVA
jgi:ornithine cyclodeaminase/alanine dehydrogenase-like protein (mu-crystallin family)